MRPLAQERENRKFTQGKISQMFKVTPTRSAVRPSGSVSPPLEQPPREKTPTASGGQGKLTSLYRTSVRKHCIRNQSLRHQLGYKRYRHDKHKQKTVFQSKERSTIRNYYSKPDVVISEAQKLRVAKKLHERGELSTGVNYIKPKGYWDWLYWCDKQRYYEEKYSPYTNAIEHICKECGNARLTNNTEFHKAICEHCYG